MRAVYEISRLVTAIISHNDAARPFYNLIATLEGISYEDAKKRVTEEVTGFMKKNYRIQKHFINDSNGNGLSMDKYLKDTEVLMEIVSFIINRFAKDVNSLHELIKVIHEA